MYCVCLGIGVEGGDVSCGGARLREQSAQRERVTSERKGAMPISDREIDKRSLSLERIPPRKMS